MARSVMAAPSTSAETAHRSGQYARLGDGVEVGGLRGRTEFGAASLAPPWL